MGETTPILEITAGPAGWRHLRSRMRRRGWALGIVVVPLLVAVALTSDRIELVGALAVLTALLVVLAALALHRWAHRHATLTVSSTELVVRGVVRRRRMARADVREIVLGYFDRVPDVDYVQVAVVDRDGRRRITLHSHVWPPTMVPDLAAALGVEVRTPTEGDQRLVPFYVRHVMAVGITLGLVLFALLLGVIALVTARADDRAEERLERAAATVEEQLAVYSRGRLDEASVPGLQSAEVRTSTDIDRPDEVTLFIGLGLATDDPEPGAERILALQRTVCAFDPDLGDVALDTVPDLNTQWLGGRQSADGSLPVRRFELPCDDPGGEAATVTDAWLRDLAGEPLGNRVRNLYLRAGAGPSLDLRIYPARADDVETVTERVCAFDDASPGRVSADVYPPDDSDPVAVDCAD